MPATPKTSIDPNQQQAKITSLIWNDCSEYVKSYRSAKKVLYRGIGREATAPRIFKASPRTDRRPMSSGAIMQDMYDNYLKKKGITALRSNSIFTSSDKNQADLYGDCYVIFPCNGTPFSWATKVDDIILDGDTDIYNDKALKELALDVRDRVLLGKPIPNFWRGYSTDGDPAEAAWVLSHTNWQTFMYDIAAANLPVAKVMSLDRLTNPAKIESQFGPTNTNFTGALSSGHEVMIGGPYYGVKLEHARPLLMDLGIKTQRVNPWINDRDSDDTW